MSCCKFRSAISKILITLRAKATYLCVPFHTKLTSECGHFKVHKVKKVKVTVVQALRLCTGRTSHRGSRVIALPFLDHGTRRGEGSASRPGRSLPQGKTRYPLYRRLGGPQGRSGQVWKISPLTRIRSPDRPVRSQSLYGLSYPAHLRYMILYFFFELLITDVI